MTDPRYTDPDPQLSDPVLRHDQSVDRMWGWIAGIAVVVLIAFILVAGWNSSNTTASNGPSATTGSATRSAPPPSGAMPGAPAPSPRGGTQ